MDSSHRDSVKFLAVAAVPAVPARCRAQRCRRQREPSRDVHLADDACMQQECIAMRSIASLPIPAGCGARRGEKWIGPCAMKIREGSGRTHRRGVPRRFASGRRESSDLPTPTLTCGSMPCMRSDILQPSVAPNSEPIGAASGSSSRTQARSRKLRGREAQAPASYAAAFGGPRGPRRHG